MYDSEYLYAWDLQGKDITVTIAKVRGVELVAEGGRKAKKPCVWFEGKDKGLAINKTNGKTIAALYGAQAEDWIGKRITLYPTTTQMGGETKDCIRIRNRVPPEQKRGAAPTRPMGSGTVAAPPAEEPDWGTPGPPAEREPGAEG
jgi:hypothetical protein